MSYYEILLFLHIGIAAIWFGGAFLFFVLFQRARMAQRMPPPVSTSFARTDIGRGGRHHDRLTGASSVGDPQTPTGADIA